MTEPTFTTDAMMRQLISHICSLLSGAAIAAVNAQTAIEAGRRNEAMGWLIDTAPLLQNATALAATTRFLHQHP